ncbi:hypothetical protein BKA70DRAFT_1421136 [Coprinopsis sp. MPI-PUGE-AT-0042]|nr:hypothetical protein BKA70DRAFT_1421136 [Coprinopsis sp. MPI-PUGE-AT-0042]
MSPYMSPTLEARREVTSSEAASLQGKPAKTPIIAGATCGAVLFVAWVVGFAIYFRKRYNRKQRKRLAEEGKCDPPPEKVNPNASTERFIIPPDPAVLMGIAKPGEMVYTAETRMSEDGHEGRPSMGSRRPTQTHKKSPSHSDSKPTSVKGKGKQVENANGHLTPEQHTPTAK